MTLPSVGRDGLFLCGDRIASATWGPLVFSFVPSAAMDSCRRVGLASTGAVRRSCSELRDLRSCRLEVEFGATGRSSRQRRQSTPLRERANGFATERPHDMVDADRLIASQSDIKKQEARVALDERGDV